MTIRNLSLAEIIAIHEQVIARFGGTSGIARLSGIQTAVAQPGATFAGKELYPTIAE